MMRIYLIVAFLIGAPAFSADSVVPRASGFGIIQVAAASAALVSNLLNRVNKKERDDLLRDMRAAKTEEEFDDAWEKVAELELHRDGSSSGRITIEKSDRQGQVVSGPSAIQLGKKKKPNAKNSQAGGGGAANSADNTQANSITQTVDDNTTQMQDLVVADGGDDSDPPPGDDTTTALAAEDDSASTHQIAGATNATATTAATVGTAGNGAASTAAPGVTLPRGWPTGRQEYFNGLVINGVRVLSPIPELLGKLEVRLDPSGRGYGVFATDYIDSETIVGIYAGAQVAFDPASRKRYTLKSPTPGQVIDAESIANMAALINHSKQSKNCEFIELNGFVVVRISKPIKPKQQLFIDYRDKFWEAFGEPYRETDESIHAHLFGGAGTLQVNRQRILHLHRPDGVIQRLAREVTDLQMQCEINSQNDNFSVRLYSFKSNGSQTLFTAFKLVPTGLPGYSFLTNVVSVDTDRFSAVMAFTLNQLASSDPGGLSRGINNPKRREFFDFLNMFAEALLRHMPDDETAAATAAQ